MSVTIKVSTHTTLARCESCGSEHLAPVPCGLTAAQRFRSVRLATEWMPAKTEDRSKTYIDDFGVEQPVKPYYDEEPIKAVFGQTGAENREQMLEETHGVGYATEDDIKNHPDLVYEHFLNDPNDIVEDTAGVFDDD